MIAATSQPETSEVAQSSDANRAIAFARQSHRPKQKGRSGCTPRRPGNSASTGGGSLHASAYIRNCRGAISTNQEVQHGPFSVFRN